ncbi:MAG TPA: outer membrane beta-barrel protein [Vicinamibacterales bacterium]|nr:outer membrane beta-barrel protein [Vicinamibacterales bacterium]
MAAGPVFAQVGSAPGATPVAPIPEPAQSWGQLRAGMLTLTPRIGLAQVGVDTNVFTGTADVRADLTATIVPKVELFFGSPSFRVRTTVASPVVLYAKYRGQSGVNPLVKTEATQRLSSKTMLFAEHNFGLQFSRPNEEIEQRVRHRSFGVQGGVQWTPSHRLAVRLAGNYGTQTFGDSMYRGVNLNQTLDYSGLGGGVTLTYSLTPYTAFSGGGVVTTYRFPNAAERDGQMRIGYVGLSFAPRALVSGSARVGYNDYRARSPVTPDYHGVVADVDLALRLGDFGQLTGGTARELKFSYSQVAPYYVSTLHEASSTSRFLRHFDVVIGAQQWRLDYPSFIPGANSLDEEFRVYSASPGIHFKKVRVGVLWSRYDYLNRGSQRDVFLATVSTGRFFINNRGIFMGGVGQ